MPENLVIEPRTMQIGQTLQTVAEIRDTLNEIKNKYPSYDEIQAKFGKLLYI